MLFNPEVTAILCSGRFDELEQKYPEVFSVCAVTWAMAKSSAQSSSDQEEIGLTDSFMFNPGDLSSTLADSSPKPGFVKEPGSKVRISQ